MGGRVREADTHQDCVFRRRDVRALMPCLAPPCHRTARFPLLAAHLLKNEVNDELAHSGPYVALVSIGNIPSLPKVPPIL